MPIAPDEQYVPDPVPDPQSLPDTLYEQTACPDDGAEIKAAHVRRLAEAYHTNFAIIGRETGILKNAQPFNVGISEQTYTFEKRIWYLNHNGPVMATYVIGLDNSTFSVPPGQSITIVGFSLEPGIVVYIRRDLPGSATPAVIQFGDGTHGGEFFSCTLFNSGSGRLSLQGFSQFGYQYVDNSGPSPELKIAIDIIEAF